MDRNDVYLSGKISGLAYSKTSDGKEFAYFLLEQNTYDRLSADKSEKQGISNLIRVMVFDERHVDYLKKVKAKNGNNVYVYARLNTHRYEKKGIEVFQINVVARTIAIVKTKAE